MDLQSQLNPEAQSGPNYDDGDGDGDDVNDDDEDDDSNDDHNDKA